MTRMFQPSFDNRASVIETQRLIEEAMPSQGVAIFFVPSMLTPLFISPNDIQFKDGLFVLKSGVVLPEGLIPLEKANNPAELSTVLGRTVSMHKMLVAGVTIIVINASEHRAQTSDSKKFVDEREINLIRENYHNFHVHVHVVSNEVYQQVKNNICAATYFSEHEVVGIRASQINQPSAPSTEVVENPNIDVLLALLAELKIPEPNTSSSIKTVIHKSA